MLVVKRNTLTPFFSTNDDNLVVILLNKLDLLFPSLIDRNNRLGLLLSHRTFNIVRELNNKSVLCNKLVGKKTEMGDKLFNVVGEHCNY
jgi:hypothetical protein